MTTALRSQAATLSLALLLWLPAAAGAAQTLASVNGTPITQADVDRTAEGIGEALGPMPEDEKQSVILDLLIDMRVLADAAEKAGLADSDAFDTEMASRRLEVLRDLYFKQYVDAAVTEDDVRARYELEIGKLQPSQEVRARHILVREKDEADGILAQLKDGANFEALAAEHSLDPGTRATGGDLGFFGPGQMVPPFEEAAFALEPGEMTDEPVQSQFGWHIIKVEEKRDRPAPAFEDVQEDIRQVVIRERFAAVLEDLKQTAEIERPAGSEK